MVKKFIIIVLAIGLCLSFTLTSKAATVVSILAEKNLLNVVGSIQFDIISPGSITSNDFSGNFPAGWLNLSLARVISAFDATGGNSLVTGMIGSFGPDVTLGGWALGNQDGEDLVLGTDFRVKMVGTNYEIAPVPVPAAIMLLGSGLVSLFAVRRRRRS